MQQAEDGDVKPGYENLRSEQALKNLYEAHGNRLFRVCMHILGNAPEAEELVQDVFTDVWLGKAVFRHQAAVATWLYRIAVNKCLMLLRKRRVLRWMGLVGVEDRHTGIAEHTHPLDKMIEQEESLRWQRLIQKLPDQQRIAFTCFYLNDLSYAETAAVMRCSVSSVESLLVRARRNLKVWLIEVK